MGFIRLGLSREAFFCEINKVIWRFVDFGNKNGEYIPNLSEGTSIYDYTVLVRFRPDGEDLMKQQRLLYQKENDIPNNIKEILMEKIYSQNWTYDLPGFIYYSELVKLIWEKRIIPQNAMLNGKTKMDAEIIIFKQAICIL